MAIWTPKLPGDRPRYLAIVEALADDVAAGRLAEGHRLPTQRDLARGLGLSTGTVTRAYALAEARGLVRGEVGRGTFVGRPPADALPVDETGELVRGAVNLGMTWPIDAENPDLAPALRRLVRRKDLAELLAYQPNAGLARHRAVGAKWIAHHDLTVDPADLVLCAGTQHAMSVACASVLGAGDTLFTEALTYPGIGAVARLFGLKVVGLACDGEGLVPDALEAACRGHGGGARMLYTVPTLHNPTTATQSEERRRELARVCERHGLFVLEDAIHQLLVEDGPPPLSRFAPERSFFAASPSKVVAGGLRIGFLRCPPGTRERAVHSVWATNWMVPPLNAEIVCGWIEDGTALETVERKRAEARARAALVQAALPPELVRQPPTSYHAWLELPEPWTSGAQFAAAAEREGVVVTPSESFAASGSCPPAVRISSSAPRSRATLEQGLERIARTLGAGPGVAAGALSKGPPIV